MIIQIDSREKARAIKKILAEFDRQDIKHPISKLLVGDYMNYDNPRVIVDRKQNLSELCSNVTSDHERFRREMLLAQQNEMSWEDIAVKLNYTWRHVHRIHSQALDSIDIKDVIVCHSKSVL